MRQLFVHDRDNPRRSGVAQSAIDAIRALSEAGESFEILIREIRRTLDQNAAMWPALRDFSRQVNWPVIQRDGTVGRADEHDLKDIFTAAFEQETRMAPGLNGGTVMLGARTSKYGKRKMGEFLTFVRAEGDQRGVRWSAPARETFDQFIPRGAA